MIRRRMVLGDNLIHVRLIIVLTNPYAGHNKSATEDRFHHAICVATQSEDTEYKKQALGQTMVPPGDSLDFYVTRFAERHCSCKMCGHSYVGQTYPTDRSSANALMLTPGERQHLQVDLLLLRVCRQLCEEANFCLWTTNTFGFADPRSFTVFLDGMTPA